MRYLLLLAILLVSITSAEAFVVLWWNMGGGNSFEKTAAEALDNSKLEKSLLSLIKTKSPDMLILGEHYDGFIAGPTRSEIIKTYPFVKAFDYNDKRKLQIIVFSKKTFEYRYLQGALKWKKEITKKDEAKDYFCKRSFQQIRILDGKREINLTPIHSMMPWTDMQNNDEGLSYISSKLGILEVGWEVVFSTNNKLGYQAKYFREYLNYFMNKSSDNSIWLALGDFNIPATYAGMETEIFKVFRGTLKTGKRIGEINYSFPYPGTKDVNKLQIDHAVSNLGTKLKYQFLPYVGSDHYPMLIRF